MRSAFGLGKLEKAEKMNYYHVLIGVIVGVAAAFVAVVFVLYLCAFFNTRLPVWFCNKMGWHLKPVKIDFDGCSLTGVCSRCGKFVLQDSQGNWF